MARILRAIETIWHKLIAAFEQDRGRLVRQKVIGLLWSKIILVPLVAGKSLERQAIPHFNAVAYSEPPDLEQNKWQLYPEAIPHGAWLHLGLDLWEPQPSWGVFDNLAVAYGLLFQHVDHMADFHRLPHDFDELGLSILQSYLNHEATRSQPLLQAVCDRCVDVLAIFKDGDNPANESRQNFLHSMRMIVDLKDAIVPTPDFDKTAQLSIEQVVNWRDRLNLGLGRLVLARYFWIADTLGLGPPAGLE